MKYEIDVTRYFQIDKEIEQLEQKLKYRRYAFYNRSMNTRISIIDDEIVTVGFNTSIEVAELIESTELIEKRIKNLKLKQKYLNRFINDLSDYDRNYLLNRYKRNKRIKNNQRIDKKLRAEVRQIETAINYHNGIGEIEDIQETIKDISTPKDHINKVLEVLEA